MKNKIGFKIKEARRKQGISQAELSNKLSISPSYLNLIESGKRNINVDLLLQIPEILDIDFRELSPKDNTNLYHDIMELLGENVFEDLDIKNLDVKSFVDVNPFIAKAMVRLGDVYKKSNKEVYDKVENISEQNLSNSKSNFPGEVVADFLQEKQNFFPLLEEYASKTFSEIQNNNRARYVLLCEYLKTKYKIKVDEVVPKDNDPFTKKFETTSKILFLSDYLTLETKKLYVASQIAQIEAMPIINNYLENFPFQSNEAKTLATISLINYTAAAMLMPYKLFYQECMKHRYDLELLQHSFATSFEQVAHRVTCLQDPNMKGIPFHMLRVDIAGNISKRLSLSGIQIPRYGGACPRWNIHSSFMSPNKIHCAVSKMTDGEKYVCIARTIEKGVGRHGVHRSMVSIGLGCKAKHAKNFVYADELNLKDDNAAVPIGVNCRTCTRMDCQQRAFPPLNKNFKIDLNKRGVSVYVGE